MAIEIGKTYKSFRDYLLNAPSKEVMASRMSDGNLMLIVKSECSVTSSPIIEKYSLSYLNYSCAKRNRSS